VILVDANIFIYSVAESYPHHVAAREWLDSRLSEHGRVGLPWPSLLAFVRIITNARIFEKPASILAAWRRVEQWLERPNVWVPLPTDQHRQILAGLLKALDRGANLIPDADLAALAIGHGLTLCSADSGFSRFPALRWKNPLAIAGQADTKH